MANVADIDTPTDKEVSESKIRIAFEDSTHLPTQHSVQNSDSRNLSLIASDSVHLVVTSPPYFNAREYSTWETLEDYVDDMAKVFSETFRVLVPGRKFCLNISDLPEKGGSGVRWLPLGPKLLLAALEVGFEIVDRIIWVKTPMKGFQYGSLPYPPSPLICDSMEYIYVLRKPSQKGKVDYSHVNPLQKEASRLTRADYMEFTKQIWTLRRVRIKGNEFGHIAPFPIEIPDRCIRLYSFVGETILDPFAGSGTTGLAAIKNRRSSIMIEKNPEYIDFIERKLESARDQNELFRHIDYGDFGISYGE